MKLWTDVRTDGRTDGRRTTETAYTISSSGAFGSGELKKKRKEKEADRRRGWKTISKSGQEWTLPQDGKGLLRIHLWCPDDLPRLWDRIVKNKNGYLQLTLTSPFNVFRLLTFKRLISLFGDLNTTSMSDMSILDVFFFCFFFLVLVLF